MRTATNMRPILYLLLAFTAAKVWSFVPQSVGVQKNLPVTQSSSLPQRQQPPLMFRDQRRSVAHVQLQGLFGLGAPEIAVILVAAAFLLGPQKLAELGKDAGKIAGELKEVPKEFQAGLKEGEQAAQLAKTQAPTAPTISEAVIDEKKE